MTDPRTAVLRRKRTTEPGLTGVDLEQAKADAALSAADKSYATATAQRAYERTGPLASEGADAAANVKNLAFARNPGAGDRLERALAELRRMMGR